MDFSAALDNWMAVNLFPEGYSSETWQLEAEAWPHPQAG
jgi:hypothetical protein